MFRTASDISQRIRDVQDETGGFTAFIPWTFQRENTALGRKITEEPTGIDYLKMLSVSRLFLRQHSAHSIVVADAGLKTRTNRASFRRGRYGFDHDRRKRRLRRRSKHRSQRKRTALSNLRSRFMPQQRDILYNYINRENVGNLDERKSMPLKKLSVAFAD